MLNFKNLTATATSLLAVLAVQAVTTTTTGPGLWSNAGIWDNGVPAAGDTAIVAHAVTLDGSSAALAAATVNPGATLTFAGDSTVLTADVVSVQGTITHEATTDTDGSDGWQRNARVQIVCVSLDVTGAIDVDGKGFAGGVSSGILPSGPGRGSYAGGGGGYGGAGHRGNGGAGGPTYGSATAPVDVGSGGAGAPNDGGRAGGAGGGAVLITASGAVTIGGEITADGASTNVWGGGGSGGTISISCATIDGSGTIRCQGGNTNILGGGGGGGRIAIDYVIALQAGVGGTNLTIGAAGGHSSASYKQFGDPGTIHMPDTQIYPKETLTGGDIVIPGFAAWCPASLSVTEGYVKFPAGFTLDVAGAVDLTNNGGLQIFSAPGSPTQVACGGNLTLAGGTIEMQGAGTTIAALDVGGDLTLTGYGEIYLTAGNDTTTYAGAQSPGVVIEVDGDLTLSNTSALRMRGDANVGGSSIVRAGNFTLGSSALVEANLAGFIGLKGGSGQGPGAGFYTSGGAGHGGEGFGSGGATYDDPDTPLQPGSSGGGAPNNGGTFGGRGGGAIQVAVCGVATLDGLMTANAGGGQFNAGGGAGGSILLSCDTLMGSTGALTANGGNGSSNGGGGGGGRIAVYAVTTLYAPALTVAGGTGTPGNGQSGSIALHNTAPACDDEITVTTSSCDDLSTSVYGALCSAVADETSFEAALAEALTTLNGLLAATPPCDVSTGACVADYLGELSTILAP